MFACTSTHQMAYQCKRYMYSTCILHILYMQLLIKVSPKLCVNVPTPIACRHYSSNLVYSSITALEIHESKLSGFGDWEHGNWGMKSVLCAHCTEGVLIREVPL